jgi:nucleoside-diphosphate-sugar epimerase
MRVFVAGASGVIGVRLVPLLVAAGHEVAGMTRSPAKLELLRGLGAEPVVGFLPAAARGRDGRRRRLEVRERRAQIKACATDDDGYAAGGESVVDRAPCEPCILDHGRLVLERPNADEPG